MSSESLTFNWSCKHTWKRSAKNTAWCLLGCSIGDFGTILFFQLSKIPFPVFGIMTLAIINGLITSIILETVILMRQNFDFRKALNEVIYFFEDSQVLLSPFLNLIIKEQQLLQLLRLIWQEHYQHDL